MESKYLNFEELYDTGKTKIFSVSNKSNMVLGNIRWHAAWRKYCFLPFGDTIWDNKCLNDIILFINQLMNERKSK